MSVHPAWTDDEIAAIRACYEAAPGDSAVPLTELAARLGRPKTSVCRLARRLGLTNPSRTMTDETRARVGKATAARIATDGHPRGMLGKRHSPEVRARLAEAFRGVARARTPEEWEARHRTAIATNLARYGRGSHDVTENAHSRSQKGYCDDLPGIFFRSTWEANYARYLDWLREQGEIASWSYEPQAFVFHGVTRAPVTYTPDFEVVERDGSVAYHEVKGWMDSKSRGKLRRMRQFYPEVRIVVIGRDEYRAIAKWAGLIPHWGEPPVPREKPDAA